MRLGVVAPSRHPVATPFAGGMESFVWHFCHRFAAAGHEVHLCAPQESDRPPGCVLHPYPIAELTSHSRADPEFGGWREYAAHHSMMAAVTSLIEADVDVVSDHSLHFYPVVLGGMVGAPIVKTLHTPPFPLLESAVRLAPADVTLVSVSEATARTWRETGRDVQVILNGVDPAAHPPGRGGSRALWAGRITPEKDPVGAIEAARRAGLGLDLAGPVSDADYFHRQVAPRLDHDVTYLGHLDPARLSAAMGAASVLLVTPQWPEPFGLVAVEAMMCGTPVAALRRGGLSEVVTPGVTGDLCDDLADLPDLVRRVRTLDRGVVAAAARAHLGIDRMVGEYEALFAEVAVAARVAEAARVARGAGSGSRLDLEAS